LETVARVRDALEPRAARRATGCASPVSVTPGASAGPWSAAPGRGSPPAQDSAALWLENARDLLGAGLPVSRAQRALEPRFELSCRRQLLDDVRPADQLALEEHLGDRRPAGERRELLSDRRIGQDVDRRHRRAGLAQRA